MSVHGPKEVSQKSNLVHDRASIEVEVNMAAFSTSERRKKVKSDRRLLELCSLVKETFSASILLNLFPQSQISIQVQVLQTDGGLTATILNCVSLAIIEAGIPCLDYVCAISCGVFEETPLLDLNQIEETCSPVLTVACMPNRNKVLTILTEGRIHTDLFQSMFQACQEGCSRLHSVFDASMKEHITILANKR